MWKLSMIEERCQEQIVCFKKEIIGTGHNTDKLSWFQFPVKIISVDRKLSMTVEWHQEQSYLFQWGDYRNKGHNLENQPQVRVLVKMASVVLKN
jgi:hypothetical protein